MYFSDYSEIPKLSNVRARQDGERQQPLTEGHEDSLSQHQNGGEEKPQQQQTGGHEGSSAARGNK